MKAKIRTANKEMTCEQFYDRYFEEDCVDTMQEMYWDDSYSSDKLLRYMLDEAKKHGVTLTDEEDWDHDKFFWNVWNSIEKGLS